MRPTSATGIRGFTLVEILVVVAIAGILVALAAANLFPSNEQTARRDAANVALAVEHARDAAWFGGRPTAITFNEGRMREWRYSGNAWEAGATREQAMAGDMRVTGLFVDGAALKPDERLVFMPDGLGIPFRIALDVRGLAYAIEGDAAGSVAMVEAR
ncbi:MAG TPA: prepilin-type N-terminal cleavage/methylation domain-containing protein [Usitatibacter sp.]|nr:prepilin-type N-terminal cleavage/methylation domain-containing protein [Usitatibacter sp.]